MSFLPIARVLAASVLTSHAVFILLATVALADPGDLLWQDQLDRGIDFGTSVTTHRNWVLAAGFSQDPLNGDGDFIRAYEARSGDLLWEHRSPKIDNSNDVSLAADGNLLFAILGTAAIRAHNIRTGAIVWQDNPSGFAADIVAHHGIVVIVGNRPRPTGQGGATSVLLVRAYDGRTGQLLWEDDSNNEGESASAVAVTDHRVFVAGGRDQSFLVRTYNLRTGELLWEDSLPASSTTAFAVTSHAGIVAIAGTRNLESGANPFVRAYDVRTGLLRWEDEIPSGAVPTNGFFDELVAHEGRIVVGGSRGGFLVQAYDVRSGNVLWRRQTEADFGVVLGLTASRQRVYAAGLDNGNWLVEAYEAKSGDIAWEDRFENAGLIGIARDDDTGRGRLFVVGDVQTPDRFSDFLIRAYDISRHHPRKADLSRLRRHPN